MNYHLVGNELAEEGISYHQVPEAKILSQKQSLIGAFKQSGPKNQEDTREKSGGSLMICEINEMPLSNS